MEAFWDDRYRPHTSLQKQLSYHGKHSDMSVINLSYIVLSSHLAQSLAGTIGISLIPHCYGNLVAMATKVKHL